MRFALLFDSGHVAVEIKGDDFEKLLIDYTEKYGHVKKAINAIKKELKDKLREL